MRPLRIFIVTFVLSLFASTAYAGWWGAWQNMGGSYTNDPALCSEFFTHTKAHVAARGADGAIWIRTWNGTSWGTAVSLGGYFRSSPSIVCSGDRIDVFAQGYDNNIKYRTYYYSDRQWHPWRVITVGTVNSGVAAIYRGGNSMTVYARNYANELVESTSAFDTWSSWKIVGGTWQGEPSASIMFFTRSAFWRVVVRGFDNYLWELIGWNTDGTARWQKYWARTWNNPEVALSRPSGSLGYYFLRNTSSTISWTTNPHAGTWENLGGSIASGPAAVWFRDNKLLLVGRAASGNLHYRVFTR